MIVEHDGMVRQVGDVSGGDGDGRLVGNAQEDLGGGRKSGAREKNEDEGRGLREIRDEEMPVVHLEEILGYEREPPTWAQHQVRNARR